MSTDDYCVALGRRFRIPGMDAEDIAQEARLAMLGSPYPKRSARLRVLDLLKMALRRPRWDELHEIPYDPDLDAVVEARDQLRQLLVLPATRNETVALGRKLRGEPIRRGEHALDQAWYRLRRRATLTC